MISKLYRKPILYLIVGVIASISLSACNFGSGEETINVDPIDIVVPLDQSNIASLVGKTFAFSTGETVHADLTGDATDVMFPSTTSFEVTSGGSTASGTLSFADGSCVLEVDASDFAAGEGPQDGDEIEIEDCAISIITDSETETGVTQPGSLRLLLDGAESSAVTVSVEIRNRGNGQVGIYVDGELVAIAQVSSGGAVINPRTPAGATGTTGTGGTGGTGGSGGGG